MAKWYDSGDLGARQMLDIPPVWLVGFLALIWVQTRVLPGFAVASLGAKLVGGMLVGVGVGLMIWALAAFRRHQTSVVPHLVPARIITTGPFALSRNPIYLGDVLVLLGAVFWWGAWLSLALIPLFISVLTRRFIAPEEVRMKENFGLEFDEFAKKTRRWL